MMPSKANAAAPHPPVPFGTAPRWRWSISLMLIKSVSFGRHGSSMPFAICPWHRRMAARCHRCRRSFHHLAERSANLHTKTSLEDRAVMENTGSARITLRAGLAGIRIHDMHPMFATWSLQNGIDPTTQILRDHRTDDQEERAVDEATPIVVIGRPPTALRESP